MCLLVIAPQSVQAGPFGVMLHTNYLPPQKQRFAAHTSLIQGLCCKVLAAERQYYRGREIAREIDAPLLGLERLDLDRVKFDRLRAMYLDRAARDKRMLVLVVPDADRFRQRLMRRGRSRIILPDLQELGFGGSFSFRLSA